MQIVALGKDTGLVLGRVLAMHVRGDSVIDPARHYIDIGKLNLIGRMHASWYACTSNLFHLDRIPLADWQDRKTAAFKKPDPEIP